MANIKLSFLGTERSETNQHELQCYANNFDEIFIKIEGDVVEHICLDVSTAIKLAKTIRTNINLIKED